LKYIHLHPIALTSLLALFIGCQSSYVDSPPAPETTVVDRENAVLNNEKHFAWLQQANGGTYITQPSVCRYVEKVGNRMAKLSSNPTLPYEFVIVQQNTPHAIALLSGKITVNSGLLFALENEAELAAVLAQNIALTPILYRSKDSKFQALFRLPIEALRSRFIDGFEYIPLSLETEIELDRRAIQSLVLAGYDPRALLSVHEKLKKLKEETPAHRGLSIHPYSEERIKAAKKLITSFQTGGYLGRAPYKDAIKPLQSVETAYRLYDFVDDSLVDGDLESALSRIDYAINIEPIEGKFHMQKGVVLRALGNLEKSLASFNRAIQLYPQYYKTYLERGKLYLQMDKLIEAQEDFTKSLSILPSSESMYQKALCFIRQGDQHNARSLLNRLINDRNPMNEMAMKLLPDTQKDFTIPPQK